MMDILVLLLCPANTDCCVNIIVHHSNVNIQLLFLHSQLTLYHPSLSGQYIFQALVESLPNLNLFAFLYTSSKKTRLTVQWYNDTFHLTVI